MKTKTNDFLIDKLIRFAIFYPYSTFIPVFVLSAVLVFNSLSIENIFGLCLATVLIAVAITFVFLLFFAMLFSKKTWCEHFYDKHYSKSGNYYNYDSDNAIYTYQQYKLIKEEEEEGGEYKHEN